jgi:sterol 3beta-glucosyltransferase
MHWPEHHRMTGFFFLDEKWAPDPALERFVNAGEPPIVVSFGSVLHQSPEALARIVLEAITGVHRRAVIQRGWTGLEFQSIPHEIHVTGTVPHHWLFPRAACVVHAGGAGTTAAALRAGIPSVIVPHVLDQFLWATLAKERGCASDVIPFVELNAERLQRAIEKALLPESRSAAGKLGENISRENGISIAADLIESYGQQSQRSGALTPAFET